jgi:hypothetical protein
LAKDFLIGIKSGEYFGTNKNLALAARIGDTPNMNSYKLVTPKVVTRISHNEFARSFLELLPEIESGTIFRVSGNPAIEAINRNFVQPARTERRLKDFRPDTPALYERQIFQRAMAFDLPLPETTLIDSTLRLRRTEGNGAFVGPHIDIHEDLPVDGINFWISFSPLGREAAGMDPCGRPIRAFQGWRLSRHGWPNDAVRYSGEKCRFV